MASKVTKNGATDTPTENTDASPLRRYLLKLKTDYGGRALTPAAVRQVVDESMGATGSLTELLYKAREDRPA
jgi:hypothetical protein